MNLTEIGISKELNDILVYNGYKVVRIDTDVSEGEYYLKQGVRGSYVIYKAEFDFSHAELLLIIEPKIPKEIVFVYSGYDYVKYGDFFLNANQQLQRWSFDEPSNNKFHSYKEMPRVELNKEIKSLS